MRNLIVAVCCVLLFGCALDRGNRFVKQSMVESSIDDVRVAGGINTVQNNSSDPVAGAIMGAVVGGSTGAVIGSAIGSTSSNKAVTETREPVACSFTAKVDGKTLTFRVSATQSKVHVFHCSVLRSGDTLALRKTEAGIVGQPATDIGYAWWIGDWDFLRPELVK